MRKTLFAITSTFLLLCGLASAQFSVTANGFPTSDTTIAPTSLSFANTVIGNNTAAQVVTLTVIGNADLTIFGVTFGTNNFIAQTNTCSGVIPAGTSCAVAVVFSPQSAATFNDALTIVSNAPSSPDTVALTGTGQSAVTNPAITLSTTSLAFGNQNVGTSSSGLVVTATNSGTSTLTMTSQNLAGGTQYARTSTCGGTLSVGANCKVTVIFTPTGSGSKTDTLAFVTNASTTPDNVAITGTGVTVAGGLLASPFFGYTNNSRSNGTNFPAITGTYGLDRLHDSPPINWPHMNTALHTYNWTEFDAMLQTDFDNGVTEVEMNVGRTPPWATSVPADTTKCTYPGATGTVGVTDSTGRGNAECYVPTDVAVDGTGTDTIFSTWITDLATHANDSAYLNGTGVWAAHGANCNRSSPCKHAHLRYYELTNEPDDGCNGTTNACFYHGSIAAMARMMEDMACILVGSQSGRRVIHKSGNGSATSCALSAIDSTALIVMPPTHGKGASVTYTSNMLYCAASGSLSSWQLPCANPNNAIALSIDIIAEHFKPGSEGITASTCGPNGNILCSVETGLQLYLANIKSILAAGQKTLPVWDDEASYCPKGFTDTSCNNGLYGDDDLSASFFPRFFLELWSLGFQGVAFYTSGDILQQTGTKGPISIQQTASYMLGATLTTPCAATGTVYRCTITNGANTYLIVWDTSKTCSSGTCTTANQTLTGFSFYQDMTSVSTRISVPGSHLVPVGIKPIILSN